ncbi:MetQ/NlpA family ABC transporter substrate-binding protein [Zongyangia hominis]|uniref:Lipoprotein n=1 Tax=Zongyangia hominis TaxID=2763677 RepID=A0A926E9M9_9FIRM|nr:MetQ/NlpA family ABC transporter substrate-binding protein [Zongyangia hominis]MBC8569758.1 MetQ/NlpA family ABC transporter substrate-binding protein [Zongyangia hominis]
MKATKKILAGLLALVLVFALASCGAKEESSSASGGESLKVLKVGANPSPHAEILENIKPLLAEKGIDLQIVEFTDYVMPNTALDQGDLDANYFQHGPYLEKFNAEKGTQLSVAANIHYELMGIYSEKLTDLGALKDGAEVAVPNDPTNETRALLLLEASGLIKLEDGADVTATVNDIAENPHNFKFTEIEAAQVPRTLGDVDIAVINGNYALEAGLIDKVLVTEEDSTEAAQKYVNILAVHTGDENREDIKLLADALRSEESKKFIEEKYGSIVKVAF